MNLFWKQLFGKLQSTEKYEAEKRQLFADFNRYAAVRESDILKEYQDLEKKMQTPEFAHNKQVYTTKKYKQTEYYHDLQRYAKMEKYVAKVDTKTAEMEKRAAEVEKKIAEMQRVAAEKGKQVQKLPKVPAVVRLSDHERKEFETLKAKVNSAEFQQMNKFWANPNRWVETEDGKMETRFNELKKNPDIVFFNGCDYQKRFAFIDYFEQILNEHFEYQKFTDSKWKPGFHYKSEQMKAVHSFMNELQANNGGQNVLMNGHLNIITKPEKTQAAYWHPNRGFLMKEYEFTSDVINGNDVINTNKGLFRAKIRFNGSEEVNHALWLVGSQKTPHINIVKYDKGKLEMGIYYGSGQNIQYAHQTIKGIKPGEWWYYELAWNQNELIWYINNLEVFRTSVCVPNENLYPVFNSFIPNNRKGGEATFEVEFFHVFKMK